MALIKVVARGEAFRIAQVMGNLFVCAEENGGCCCGHVEKGRARVNKDLYASEWEGRSLRNKLHLTFVGCLGPCPVGNNAMLVVHGQTIWFKDLNDDRLIPLIFDYAETVLKEGNVVAPGADLADHVYQRYVPAPAPDRSAVAVDAGSVAEEADFNGIDPVCMMTVDPATAAFHSDYAGKTYYFCAPSCKRSFDKNPVAYLGTGQSNPAKDAEPAAMATGGAHGSRTFRVPAISCDHCVRSIRNELLALPGVDLVQGDPDTRMVTVQWAPPASWEQIRAALEVIEYPAAATD